MGEWRRREGRDRHFEREERGDTEAVPQAVKRQLAQRCVRPIFSFPFAHLSQKQLPERVQTGRLQHPADNSQKGKKKASKILQLRCCSCDWVSDAPPWE